MEEPRIAVIKIPEGVNPPSVSEFASEIGKAIGGRAFVIPMDYDIMIGKAAKKELDLFHKFVHQALGITELGK